MKQVSTSVASPAKTLAGGGTVVRILAAISFCHLLNDMLQSLIPAVYPILKASYHLDFGQIGLITLTSQLTASLLQPLVGLYTDRRSTPYSPKPRICEKMRSANSSLMPFSIMRGTKRS